MSRKVLALLIALTVVAFVSAGLAYAQAKAPDVVVLKGNQTLGAVKMDHAAHGKLPNVTCVQCHHASKPEMPNKAENQKCADCHTRVAKAPMKTKMQAAFHDPLAKSGLCITCHTQQNKAGKKAPVKCTECHSKKNG